MTHVSDKICMNCEFFFKGFNQCRRHAPHPRVIRDRGDDDDFDPIVVNSNWPFVKGDDWCGDFKLITEK